MKILSFLLLLKPQHSQAKPIPQGSALEPCALGPFDVIEYTKESEKDVQGPAQQLAYSCTASGDAGMSFCLDQKPLLIYLLIMLTAS